MNELAGLARQNGTTGVYALVYQAVRDAIRDHVAERKPQPVAQEPEGVASIRGEQVYLRGPHPVIFSRWRSSCPGCGGLIQVDDRIVGLARVDNPHQCVWLCVYCAPIEDD